MRIIKFHGISFFSGSYTEIKRKIDKGGILVAPAASALSQIYKNRNYYNALKKSDVAILDSGFFCILLRIFKRVRAIKLSGFLFLSRFLNEKIHGKIHGKILLIDPSKASRKLNSAFLKSKGIKNFKSYLAPLYNSNIHDVKLLKLIKIYKPKYIIINLGGGTQELVALYIKNNINFKISIFCTGAAIAFMTGEQAPINKVIDRLYLGWFIRFLWNPIKNFKRTVQSFNLIKFFI